MEDIPTPVKKKQSKATNKETSEEVTEDRGRKSPRRKRDQSNERRQRDDEDEEVLVDEADEVMLTSVPSLSKFQDDLKHISKSISKIQQTASFVKAEREHDKEKEKEKINSNLKKKKEEEEREKEREDRRLAVSSAASTPLAHHHTTSYRYDDSRLVSSSLRKSADEALPLPLPQSNSSFIVGDHQPVSPSRASLPQAPASTLITELEEKLLREQRKNNLLLEQVQSMPVSLSVAQAEKRVLEGKLSKASEAYEYNIQKIQQHAVSKIKEFEAFLQVEKSEKVELQQQLKEQTQTIHQLTHHVKILQASVANQQQLNNINLSMPGFRSPEHTGAVNTSFGTNVGVVSSAAAHPGPHSIADTPAMRRTFASMTGSMTSGAMNAMHDLPSARKPVGTNLSVLRTPASIAAVTNPSAVELEVPPPPWEKGSVPLSAVRLSGAGITSAVTPSSSLHKR